MTFSIIVPVYNIEDKISKCLKSILNQSYANFEILVVIDGSTDRSESICKTFEKEDFRIKVISKKNGGLVSARKCGAEIASGEYIINVDGDDYIDNNYLQELSEIIKEYDPDMIACGYREISNGNIRTYSNFLQDGFYRMKDLNMIKNRIIYDKTQKGFKGGVLINTIWTKVVKREIYVKCQSYVPTYITVGEDLILNAYLMKEIQSLYVSSNIYYNYIVYMSSMMHKYNIKNIRHYLDVAEELNKIDYVTKSDIDVYLFQAYISEMRKIAQNCSKYAEFNQIYNSIPEIPKLHKHAKRACVQRKTLEIAIKSLLVNTSNKILLYLICKYS